MPTAPHFPNPVTRYHQQPQLHQRSSCLHTGLSRAAPLCTTAATRSRVSSSPELSTWDPCESSARATPFANIHLHADRSSATYERSASTSQAGTHHAIGADPRAGRGPFPKPRALVLSMVRFGQAKPDGLGHTDTADSDLMHHQYRLSVLQWNPGPARRNPTNIIAATWWTISRGKTYKKPVITFLTSPISSLRTLATRTSPSCSTRTRFEPDPAVYAFQRSLIQRRHVGRGSTHCSLTFASPSLFLALPQSHSALYTSTMLWPRKRDASTDLASPTYMRT